MVRFGFLLLSFRRVGDVGRPELESDAGRYVPLGWGLFESMVSADVVGECRRDEGEKRAQLFFFFPLS